MSEDGEVVASFLVRVNLRAQPGKSVKIPTNARLEDLIKQAVEDESLEGGMGDYTISASVSSERLDK